MRDIMFTELKECTKKIRQITDEGIRAAGNCMLADTVDLVYSMLRIGRTEGLLALEEAAQNLGDLKNANYLSSLIMLIVDGVAPETVEETGMTRYFASGVEGYEALQYIVMLIGSLTMQQGEHPQILEEKLLAIIPNEAAKLYQKKKAEHDEEREGDSEKKQEYLEKFYEGGIAARSGDEFYFPLKVVDYVICTLDDRSVQRLLREIEFSDLEIALRGLSGACRKKIFTNMSERLAVMVAQDIEGSCCVRIKDVVKASLKIFNTLLLLLDIGEIVQEGSDILKAFNDIFKASLDVPKEIEKGKAKEELIKIVNEYNWSENRMVKLPWGEDE